MTQNHKHIQETLLHRLSTLFSLSENMQQHRYLLPELLVKTIKDTHRLTNKGVSHINCEEIVELLNMDCTTEEILLLNQIEHALRKSKDYKEISEQYSDTVFLSIASKLQQYLNKG